MSNSKMLELNRKFTAGSTPAPDLNDQYLENKGFYRKHTARDSTSLFRVISEQVFDIQLYHEKVRADCVKYMRDHKRYYEKSVKRNKFDDYLQQLECVTTYGTKLELEALGHMYKRNIVLFEPLTTGRWFLRNEKYDDSKVLNVFCLSGSGNHYRRFNEHFDSVFTLEYIETAALCQSIIYDILYTKVCKVPDAMLAVEHMLHDPSALHYVSIPPKNEGDRIVEKAVTDDGREFVMDIAENTVCVLEEDSLCHFHNKHNFTEVVHVEPGSFGNFDPKYECYERKQIRYSRMLIDSNKSCVRQLLEQNITPFPFKVAKSLDAFMYRNIEFDVWNECRRMLRHRSWYYGGNELQVGGKCLVNYEGKSYRGYIQDLPSNGAPCLVYIDSLGKKVNVPYSALLPINDGKPWGYDRRNGYSNYRQQGPPGHFGRYPYIKSIGSFEDLEDEKRMMYPQIAITYKESSTASSEMTLKRYTSTNQFQPPPYEQLAMPFVFEHNVKNTKGMSEIQATPPHANNGGNEKNDGKSQCGPNTNQGQDDIKDRESTPQPPMHHQPQQLQMTQPPAPPLLEVATYPTSTTMMYNGAQGTSFYYPTAYGYPTTPTCDQQYVYEPSMINGTSYYGQPIGQPAYGSLPNPYYNYTVPPPPPANLQQPIPLFAVGAPPMIGSSPASLNPYQTYVPQPVIPQRGGGKDMVNFLVGPSVAPNGSDLPMHDLVTLRYFYNLGIEYHRGQQSRGSEPPPNTIEPTTSVASDVNQLSSDVQSSLKIKTEEPNVTQTTSGESLTTSTTNSSSPLVKADSFSGFSQNKEHNTGGGGAASGFQRNNRRGGYRGNNRRNGYENRYNNNNGYHHNNGNNGGESGGYRNNRNYANNNSNNHYQNENQRFGGGRPAEMTVHSNSTNSLSPNNPLSDGSGSSEASTIPYQPMYVQPFYSAPPSYFVAPEPNGGDVNQQYVQFVQPQQPAYNTMPSGNYMPTVFIPQMTNGGPGNGEMMMSAPNNDMGSGDPMMGNTQNGPAYGYTNYPSFIYGPPPSTQAMMQPLRQTSSVGNVWYPNTSQSGPQQQSGSGNNNNNNGFNSSGNVSH